MKRKVLSLLLASTMALSLTACNRDDSGANTSGTTSGSNSTSTGSQTTAPETTANGLVKAADGFPNKEITIYLDSDPGTETYNIMSEFAKYVTKYAEVDVKLDPYEGGSGVLALSEMMKNDSDGYSWMHQSLTLPLTIGFETAPYKAEEIQPVAGLYGDSLVVSVLPDSEFQSIDDIVTYAKNNPGKFNWGGAKTKAAIQVGSAKFWDCADIDVNYIAYPSGTDALVAVLGGNTMCNASSVSGALDYYKNGELKVLAVSAAERVAVMPDVPTFEELGYSDMTGYSIYRGTYVKAGVPQEHLEVLEQLHQLIANDSGWQAYLDSLSKEKDYRGTEEYTQWYNDTVAFTQEFDFD